MRLIPIYLERRFDEICKEKDYVPFRWFQEWKIVDQEQPFYFVEQWTLKRNERFI
jgi:hypothetical protein